MDWVQCVVWLVQSVCLVDITAVSTDGDLHEPVDEEATQRVGPREEVFKDDKSDETELDDCWVARVNQI